MTHDWEPARIENIEPPTGENYLPNQREQPPNRAVSPAGQLRVRPGMFINMACVADHRFKSALGTALVATVFLCLPGCDGREENGELLSPSQVDAEKEISSTLTYATLTNKIISDIDRDPDAWPEKRKHLLLMELIYLLELQTTPPTDELVEAAGTSMVHLHGSNALGLLGVSSHDELTDVAESADILPKHKAVFTDEEHAQYGPLKALVEDCLKFDISQLD